MNKRDLEQYHKHKQLIGAYLAELSGDLTTVDSVTGSCVAYPYTKRTVTIRGRDVQREKWLRLRVSALNKQCARIEALVIGIEDEYIRGLLWMHYIQGMSWPKVRRTVRARVTADYLRKMAQKHLENGC